MNMAGRARRAETPRLCAAGSVHRDLAKGRAAKYGRLTASLCKRVTKGSEQRSSEVVALWARRCIFYLIVAIFCAYLTLSASYEHF